MLSICQYLDVSDLLNLGLVSKLGFSYSRFYPLWNPDDSPLVHMDEKLNVLSIFETSSRARNYARIRPISDMICSALFPDKAEQKVENCSVAELKNRLRALNLPVSGKKAVLIARLAEASVPASKKAKTTK
jgi:hypothetical protein